MSAGPGVQIQPSLATIREAQKLLAKYFAPTRLIHAPFLGERVGKNVYLKLETELPTGSFKVRGALYALAERMKKGTVREVAASSTGNHGAAVAYAAKEFGIAAKIFLPANCNPVLPLVTVKNKTTDATRTVCDLGRGLAGKWADIGGFRVPPLRGLAARAPYFHDGQAKNIKQAIRYHEQRFNIDLSHGKRADLEAFLGAL